jgi:purine-binding chemotaxis protein CheW
MNKINFDDIKHYINYRLGNENFAISVDRVLEIIKHRVMTKVPNSSQYIKGVINFRGEIVPVIDMHKRFNMEKDESHEGMIVVINGDSEKSNYHIGLLVDEVEDVIEFKYRDLRKSPDMGINYDMSFIDGIVDIESRFIMVLNIEKVLNKTELADVKVGV